MIETSGGKIIDVIVSWGPGGILALIFMGVSWILWIQLGKQRELNERIMKDRLDEVRQVTTDMTELLVKANIALQASTSNHESREQTLRTLVAAMEGIRTMIENNRTHFADLGKRMEDTLAQILRRNQ